ncbi:hypothetical protein M0804_004656 [Polistes exclamans]|nr:hypothetical protein M0804_004656 [Polistes exclamans]
MQDCNPSGIVRYERAWGGSSLVGKRKPPIKDNGAHRLPSQFWQLNVKAKQPKQNDDQDLPIPAPIPAALTVGTYASSYNAHAINHAIAAPYLAAHAVAPAPAIAAAPLAYSALPAAYAYPAAPLLAGRR